MCENPLKHRTVAPASPPFLYAISLPNRTFYLDTGLSLWSKAPAREVFRVTEHPNIIQRPARPTAAAPLAGGWVLGVVELGRGATHSNSERNHTGFSPGEPAQVQPFTGKRRKRWDGGEIWRQRVVMLR